MPARKTKPLPPFVARVLGLLLPLGPVHARPMFGGHGFCLDGVMFALSTGERLYFKLDEESRARFEKAGSAPFSYQRRRPDGESRMVVMSYSEAPKGTLASASRLLPWAELGLAAARRAARKGARQGPRQATRNSLSRLPSRG